MQAYQDVKEAPKSWQDQNAYEQHNAAGGGMKRSRDEEEDEEEYDKNEGSRSKYKCGLCGQVLALPLTAQCCARCAILTLPHALFLSLRVSF